MIHLPASVRVYLCLTACDMRKSFDSLHALVREHLELDAFAGHLFVFTSRRIGSRFCTGTGMDSRCGASAWKRAPMLCRWVQGRKRGGVRSRRRSWERC